MVRASAIAEKAGIPAVSIISTAFLAQARATAKGQGISDPAIAEYPGVIMTEGNAELQRKVEDILVDRIVKGLTTPRVKKQTAKTGEPAPRDIVFAGNLAEVQQFFIDNLWTDGLPVIPPTIEKVEEFLKFTERPPEQVLGALLPENRQATVWNVAVNGVMAGCRPEYMPILIAVVEAIADPRFRIQDAGSTPGWEPLIILNGTIIKELNFNYGAGVMRVGRQANTSIGRFLRLYMINVPGLRITPGATDKGCIAYTFNNVLAENEDAVREMGWEPFSVDRGFKAGDNVVTVQSVIYTSPPTYSAGDTPLEHVEQFTEVMGRRTVAYWAAVGVRHNAWYPLLVMSPSVASVIAKGGWTKSDIRQYLYQNARESAGLLEKMSNPVGIGFNFCEAVAKGEAKQLYCESTDPDRMVPVFLEPDWIGIAVSGDPGRNQSKMYVQNQTQGVPVSKLVELPASWQHKH